MGNNPRCLTFHLHRRICSEGDRNNNEDGSKACLSFAGFICRTIEWKISEERKRVFQQSSLYKQREETVTKSIFDEGWTTTTTRLDCMIAWLTITDSDDGKSGKRKKKAYELVASTHHAHQHVIFHFSTEGTPSNILHFFQLKQFTCQKRRALFKKRGRNSANRAAERRKTFTSAQAL